MNIQLDKFKNKLLNYFNEKIEEQDKKIEELSDDILKMNIEVEETKKIIYGLKNNIDDSQDIFSPSNNNDSFIIQEIKKLNSRVDEIGECIDIKKEEISKSKEKIREANRMNSYIRKFQIRNDEINNQENNKDGKKNENGEDVIKEIKDKVDFCRKICITDSNRCKLELDNIYEMINKI